VKRKNTTEWIAAGSVYGGWHGRSGTMTSGILKGMPIEQAAHAERRGAGFSRSATATSASKRT
jgi:hypothetical protein